jgi:hypothetical protein
MISRSVFRFIAVVAVLAACGDDAPAPGAVPPMGPGSVPPVPGMPGVPPVPVPVPVPAPGACIAGTWRANDFLAMVRRNIRRGLPEGGTLTHASGNVDITIPAPDAAGNGTLAVQSNDVVYRAVTREQGVTVNITLTMTGASQNPFQVLPGNMIRVGDEVAGGTLSARVNAQATGIVRFSRNQTERFDLDGTFAFECTQTQLSVWDVGANGQRRGQPIVRVRLP